MTPLALVALAICTAANVACAVVVLRALGLLRPQEQVAYDPPRDPPQSPQSQPVHWVPTKQAGRLQRVLREYGFFVLNLGSANGVTALMICEGSV